MSVDDKLTDQQWRVLERLDAALHSAEECGLLDVLCSEKDDDFVETIHIAFQEGTM